MSDLWIATSYFTTFYNYQNSACPHTSQNFNSNQEGANLNYRTHVAKANSTKYNEFNSKIPRLSYCNKPTLTK